MLKEDRFCEDCTYYDSEHMMGNYVKETVSTPISKNKKICCDPLQDNKEHSCTYFKKREDDNFLMWAIICSMIAFAVLIIVAITS